MICKKTVKQFGTGSDKQIDRNFHLYLATYSSARLKYIIAYGGIVDNIKKTSLIRICIFIISFTFALKRRYIFE